MGRPPLARQLRCRLHAGRRFNRSRLATSGEAVAGSKHFRLPCTLKTRRNHMITSAELMARSYGHLVASTELLLRLAQASAVYHRMPAGGGACPGVGGATDPLSKAAGLLAEPDEALKVEAVSLDGWLLSHARVSRASMSKSETHQPK